MRTLTAQHCKLSVPAHETDGEPLADRTRTALEFYGGYSFSGAVGEAGDVSVSFDPRTVSGGLPAIVAYAESLGEYTLELMRWQDEPCQHEGGVPHEWAPVNASEQECTVCGDRRALPDECIDCQSIEECRANGHG